MVNLQKRIEKSFSSLSKQVKYFNLLVGADARVYELIPDGNNFVDFKGLMDLHWVLLIISIKPLLFLVTLITMI